MYRWLLTIVAGAVTGLVATGINLGVRKLTRFKFHQTFTAVQVALQLDGTTGAGSVGGAAADPPFVWPCILFVGISVSYVSVATVLVSCIEPVARGSGIPEIKCYLNGVNIPRVVRSPPTSHPNTQHTTRARTHNCTASPGCFETAASRGPLNAPGPLGRAWSGAQVRFRTLACKAFGVLFSVAGGLPVGKGGAGARPVDSHQLTKPSCSERCCAASVLCVHAELSTPVCPLGVLRSEGPMIHSGAVVAAGVSQGKCSSFDLDSLDSKFTKFSAVRAFVSLLLS